MQKLFLLTFVLNLWPLNGIVIIDITIVIISKEQSIVNIIRIKKAILFFYLYYQGW